MTASIQTLRQESAYPLAEAIALAGIEFMTSILGPESITEQAIELAPQIRPALQQDDRVVWQSIQEQALQERVCPACQIQ